MAGKVGSTVGVVLHCKNLNKALVCQGLRVIELPHVAVRCTCYWDVNGMRLHIRFEPHASVDGSVNCVTAEIVWTEPKERGFGKLAAWARRYFGCDNGEVDREGAIVAPRALLEPADYPLVVSANTLNARSRQQARPPDERGTSRHFEKYVKRVAPSAVRDASTIHCRRTPIFNYSRPKLTRSRTAAATKSSGSSLEPYSATHTTRPFAYS